MASLISQLRHGDYDSPIVVNSHDYPPFWATDYLDIVDVINFRPGPRVVLYFKFHLQF